MDIAQLQPYMPWIVMALTGIVAGWLAGLILGGKAGLLRKLIVGIAGAVVGGWLVNTGLLPVPVEVTNITGMVPYGTQIAVSTVGALLIMIVARVVFR